MRQGEPPAPAGSKHHSPQHCRQPTAAVPHLLLPLPLPWPPPPCSNLFEWAVTVLGPPDTLYEGGFFNAVLKFPRDYPQHPPDMRFTSEMWCVCSPLAGTLTKLGWAGLDGVGLSCLAG